MGLLQRFGFRKLSKKEQRIQHEIYIQAARNAWVVAMTLLLLFSLYFLTKGQMDKFWPLNFLLNTILVVYWGSVIYLSWKQKE